MNLVRRNRKAAAARIGISYKWYCAQSGRGKKWCPACRRWHHKEHFPRDPSKHDGLNVYCRKAQAAKDKAKRPPKPPRDKGGRRTPERDGDKNQARNRIAYLVRIGKLPKASSLPCKECGKNYGAREWHHHKGYGIGCHELVIPLCKWCHAQADAIQYRAAGIVDEPIPD